MCHDEDNVKVPFISEEPSCEVKEANSANTLFTLEVQVVNEEDFLKKVYGRFDNWDPFWDGNPRGTIVKFVQRS